MRIRRVLVGSAAGLVLALTLGVVACSSPQPDPPAASAGSDASWVTPAAFTGTVDRSLTERLPQAAGATEPRSRAAANVVPPTNRWYSGMVFGSPPQTVFPFPLAVTPAVAGFTYAAPTVTASASTITAPPGPGLKVSIPADGYTVVHADPVAVTARYAHGKSPLGELTMAEGWPAVGWRSITATTLTPSTALIPAGSGAWRAEIGGRTFGVRAPGAVWNGRTLRVPADATALWFVVGAGSSIQKWAAALDGTVASVRAQYRLGTTADTRLSYLGVHRTVLVPPPGVTDVSPRTCTLGTFRTAYGTVPACAATSLTWSVPRIRPAASFDLRNLDADTRRALARQVTADVAATPSPLPTDTYGGGKALARLAELWQIAHAVGATATAVRVTERLQAELKPWVSATSCRPGATRCFRYDPVLRTVVGEVASFGSDAANDHHFHYGYFLTAAATLAQARPALVPQLRPVIDAIAADLATGAGATALPETRVFDPFRGHSWASGFSPFADGNNQESSSEAVNAWNGLALWATATGDKRAQQTAEWMLSAEADAARTQWISPPAGTLAAGYAHRIVSLNWGGKRDYATWFSAEPSAILGIQLIPLGPVALRYLPSAPAAVAEAGGTAAVGHPLGDYVLMYSALDGSSALTTAERVARGMPGSAIDAGNSRSAVLAWIIAARLDAARQKSP